MWNSRYSVPHCMHGMMANDFCSCSVMSDDDIWCLQLQCDVFWCCMVLWCLNAYNILMTRPIVNMILWYNNRLGYGIFTVQAEVWIFFTKLGSLPKMPLRQLGPLPKKLYKGMDEIIPIRILFICCLQFTLIMKL